MNRTKLTTGSAAVSNSSYTTAAITPAADRLLLAFVLNASAGLLPPTPTTPTLTGMGLTWEAVESVSSGSHRLTCLRAMAVGAAPPPGVITFDFAGQTQALCAWSVFEYDNVDIERDERVGCGHPTSERDGGRGHLIVYAAQCLW